jgi:Transposase DDE domain
LVERWNVIEGEELESSERLSVSEDFEYLLRLLPEGWQAKAKELGALRRCRKVQSAEVLLRVLLIHLAEGCSLRETALRAARGQIAQLSDVAIMDRLRLSGSWFRWMNVGLVQRWIEREPRRLYGTQRRINLVDATRIQEPGPTGSSWTLHYCIELVSLACRQWVVTDWQGNGESFWRFKPQAQELYIADRAYGTRAGIATFRRAGAEVLVRFALDNLPLLQPSSHKRFNLLSRLGRLQAAQLGDWPVQLEYEKERFAGRVCAVKRSRQAAEQAIKKFLLTSKRKGQQPKASTLEAQRYVFVFTTLSPAELSAKQALELYRGRWQIELVFKRLKSILQMGHLRKIDPDSALSWIEGKLFVALLLEALLRQAESFFPWGFPLDSPPALPLA